MLHVAGPGEGCSSPRENPGKPGRKNQARFLQTPGNFNDAGPVGFPGQLAEGEKWKTCPYYPDHKYLRATKHLTRCHERYEKMKKERGEPMDISICKYNWDHHIRTVDLEKHLKLCVDQFVAQAYLNNYFKSMRSSNMRGLEQEEEESGLKSKTKN